MNLFYKSKSMRKSITLFDDQYAFYKELKSEKLLVAFVEYMFEDKEPEWLNSLEQTIRNSLLVRMNTQKSKSNGWAKSRWWGRPKQQAEKQQKNNTKTTEEQQVKDNISKDILLKDKVKEEDKVKDKKNKYLDFVCLSESEHEKLISQLWERLTNELIEKLNNYIWSTGKRYKSHYFTILSRSKKESGATTHSQAELMKERDRQRRLEEAQKILHRSQDQDGDTTKDKAFDRRANIMSG